MMRAINLKKWQTQKLLRNLKEKGYLRQINHGGGMRNYVSYQIPLNMFGNITPEPMTPEQIAELRAKYARKKKTDQADDADAAESQAQPDQAPASSPTTTTTTAPGQARPFPAVAAALSTAIVPAPAPIPITPPPMTPEQQEQQDIQAEIAAWEEKINYYRLQRDFQPELSAKWKRWNRHLERAVDAQSQWKQLAIQTVTVLTVVETPKGEYA